MNTTKKTLDLAETFTLTEQSLPAPPAVPGGVGEEGAAPFLHHYLIRHYLPE